MEYLVPFLIVGLFMYFGRVKIPKGLKPVPALDIELPARSKATISVNGEELIQLPLADNDIEDYKRDRKNLSKRSKVLKYRTIKTSDCEALINLSDYVHLTDDELRVDIAYSRDGNYQSAEVDYAIAYVHDGKLLIDSDIEEKNFRLEEQQGTITVTFTNLAERTQKRIKRFSKD